MTSSAGGILVIGRQGQLARSLAATGRSDVICMGRPEADLADQEGIARLMADVRPRIVLNAGGFTKVDAAEAQQDEAFALNRDGPANLARLCATAGIPLIHVSTDCVFDGNQARPYEPGDRPAPLSVYGRSKLAGEQAVSALLPRHLIVRVSWVFSEHADNFVRTMLKLASQREVISVVRDQVGYPSYCPDLAAGLLAMSDHVLRPEFDAWGTYHLAGEERMDRASMAEAIFAESRLVGGPAARVEGVLTVDYPTPAKRPLNARLQSDYTAAVFGIRLPEWRIGLKQTVKVLAPEISGQNWKSGAKAGLFEGPVNGP